VKILDKYILKTYVITFLSVGVIIFFILTLQGIWMLIGELAGKDLDFFTLLKFITYFSPTILPLSLPLTILLTSIMVFGSFSENYEFAAMKSSGISLTRAMKPLIIFIALVGVFAFFVSNTIIPKAQYAYLNMRRDIVYKTPASAIREGQFSAMGNFYIKVSKKYGENENLIENVTIHQISKSGNGNTLVIRSKKGEFISDEKTNTLQLILFDGNYYEDIIPADYQDRPKMPYAKSAFKRYIINIDLAPLTNTNLDGDFTTHNMLNLDELNFTIDSLQFEKKKEALSFADNVNINYTYPVIDTTTTAIATVVPKKIQHKTNVLDYVKTEHKKQIIEMAFNNVTNLNYSLVAAKANLSFRQKTINEHQLALNEKFVIAYACLLMFFLGAPLGAIVRKGGLGLPIVLAVSIFIIFHFMNVLGKKLAGGASLSPFLGAWIGSILLTPFAINMTKNATRDKGAMDASAKFKTFFENIKNRFTKNTETDEHVQT
jgi:lipopolysaccharide export system permease protein